MSELHPAVRARAGWLPRRDDDQLPGLDRRVGGHARRRAVVDGARRTGGAADDRQHGGPGRGAVVVLSAVQDHLGGDRVPGGSERAGVSDAGPTRPSDEGPGVATDQAIVHARSAMSDWLPAASTA